MGKGLSTLRGSSTSSSLSSAPSSAYVRSDEKKDANWTTFLAYNKSSKNKNQNQEFNKAMPVDLKRIPDVVRVMWDYSFDTKCFKNRVGFFRSSLEQEILALAYNAAPLDEVERCVRTAYANREQHLLATLEKATIEAINNLDVNILDEKGVLIAEGMAERLMQLHEELRPKTYPTSLNLIKHAVPFETKEEKAAREKANLVEVKKVFDAFVKPDEETLPAEIKAFNAFVRPTTQLNRLHLLFAAFDELATRGSELPRTWYGPRADKFCFEVIGAAIEMGVSPRMRRILALGIHFIFNRTKIAVRQLDIDGAAFIGGRDSDRELGVNSYFDVFGAESNWVLRLPIGGDGALCRSYDMPRLCQTYYEQFHQRCELMQRSDSVEMPRRDAGGARNSP